MASSESCQPSRNLIGIGKKLKESIFKSNNQINSTVQPENSKKRIRMCRITHDWYLNEKIVVVPVCLNARCCSAGCVDNVLY